MIKFGVRWLVFILLLIILAIDGLAAYSPDANTVALWHFDEGSGNQVFDATGNGNTGNIEGATWTTDSAFGSALSFDGVNDRISVVKTPSVDLTSQVTLEAWVKRNSNTPGTIISSNGPFYIAINPEFRFPIDGTIRVGVYTTDGWHEFSSITSLQVGLWYHIAMTYDGSRLRIFVNGVEDSYIPVSGPIRVVSQHLYLGWGEPGHNQYFDGIIDEVRISDIARTSFDVAPPEPPTPQINLTELIDNLTSKVNNLELQVLELQNQTQEDRQRISILESVFNALSNSVSSLQNTVNNIFTNLFGLPRGLRQEMVCSALKATNQTSATGFGLTCIINDKGACSCV